MPDCNAVQLLIELNTIQLLVGVLVILIAATGFIYWAIQNLGRDLREEMRRMELGLRGNTPQAKRRSRRDMRGHDMPGIEALLRGDARER